MTIQTLLSGSLPLDTGSSMGGREQWVLICHPASMEESADEIRRHDRAIPYSDRAKPGRTSLL
jgi:hypothetical protein